MNTNTRHAIAAALLTGIVAAGAVACSSAASPRSRPHAPAQPAAATTPALTAAEQKFVSDLGQQVPEVSGNTLAQQAELGTQICQSLAAGASASTIEGMMTSKNWGSVSKILQLAEADLCPQYETKVLASFSGNGDQTTGQFTVGGNGNWVLNWTYNCSSFGTESNFIVNEDGGSDPNGAGVNELGNGSSGQTNVYTDTGTHYLSVISACSWTMQVVGSSG